MSPVTTWILLNQFTVITHLLIPSELVSWYDPGGKLSIVDQVSEVPTCVCSKRCLGLASVVMSEMLCACDDVKVTTIATRPEFTELAAGKQLPLFTVKGNEDGGSFGRLTAVELRQANSISLQNQLIF